MLQIECLKVVLYFESPFLNKSTYLRDPRSDFYVFIKLSDMLRIL